MTGRSDTFEGIINDLFDSHAVAQSAPSIYGIITVEGSLREFDHVAGEQFKRALLGVSPPSVTIEPSELEQLQHDRTSSVFSTALQDVVNCSNLAVQKGKELCVAGPGLVTFERGAKKTVSELLGESGVIGTVVGAERSNYFVKHGVGKTTGNSSLRTKLSLRWGSVLILENPTTINLAEDRRVQRGDMVRVPILPNELSWSHLRVGSI